MGGIIGFLLDWIMWFIAGVIDFVITLFTTLFASYLYTLGAMLLLLVDFVQALFRGLAGIGTYWWNGEAMVNQDPILRLITHEMVLQVLLALFIVAMVLLIIATVVQILRVQYTTEGAKNSPGPIIGQAFKALAMFALVPISAVMGIFLANQILRAVDGATNPQGAHTIGGAIFLASAYQSNRARMGNPFPSETNMGEWFRDIIDNAMGHRIYFDSSTGEIVGPFGGGDNGGTTNRYGQGFVGTSSILHERRAQIADRIDFAFAINAPNLNSIEWNTAVYVRGGGGGIGFLQANPSVFSYTDVAMVNAYYQLSSINFLVMYAAALAVLWALFSACFGLVMRMYKVVMLFVVAPPIIALHPLDNGAAFKNWTKQFVGAVAGIYGTVIALNVFVMMLPILRNIQLFDPTPRLDNILDTGAFFTTNAIWNQLVYLMFVIVGCFMIKSGAKILSGIIGAQDVLEEGGGVTGKAAKIGAAVGAGAFLLSRMGQSARAGSQADKLENLAANEEDEGKKKDYQKRAQEAREKQTYYKGRGRANMGSMLSNAGFESGAKAYGHYSKNKAEMEKMNLKRDARQDSLAIQDALNAGDAIAIGKVKGRMSNNERAHLANMERANHAKYSNDLIDAEFSAPGVAQAQSQAYIDSFNKAMGVGSAKFDIDQYNQKDVFDAAINSGVSNDDLKVLKKAIDTGDQAKIKEQRNAIAGQMATAQAKINSLTSEIAHINTLSGSAKIKATETLNQKFSDFGQNRDSAMLISHAHNLNKIKNEAELIKADLDMYKDVVDPSTKPTTIVGMDKLQQTMDDINKKLP